MRCLENDYKREKAKRIGHFLHRNCLLKHVTKGKIKGMGSRGRRGKQLLDDPKESEKILKIETGSTR
jgi:hypothetical protein